MCSHARRGSAWPARFRSVSSWHGFRVNHSRSGSAWAARFRSGSSWHGFRVDHSRSGSSWHESGATTPGAGLTGTHLAWVTPGAGVPQSPSRRGKHGRASGAADRVPSRGPPRRASKPTRNYVILVARSEAGGARLRVREHRARAVPREGTRPKAPERACSTAPKQVCTPRSRCAPRRTRSRCAQPRSRSAQREPLVHSRGRSV